jgi:hypothetical protein
MKTSLFILAFAMYGTFFDENAQRKVLYSRDTSTPLSLYIVKLAFTDRTKIKSITGYL